MKYRQRKKNYKKKYGKAPVRSKISGEMLWNFSPEEAIIINLGYSIGEGIRHGIEDVIIPNVFKVVRSLGEALIGLCDNYRSEEDEELFRTPNRDKETLR